MGLPFLDDKKKSIADLIVSERRPDESKEEEAKPSEGLMAASQDLIDAVHSKDASAVHAALMAHRELQDSEGMDQDE